MGKKKKLTIDLLKKEAACFSRFECQHKEKSIYGVTDGKAIGAYLEHKFKSYLARKYKFINGSSAKGIDFPELNVDIKVTSLKQPQSSCPFKSARQKIYGLGYALLVFVYKKTDISKIKSGNLRILHNVFIETENTADYQLTTGLLRIIKNKGNQDDLAAFLEDKLLPVDELERSKLASEILRHKPQIGCLTISNALQWRLQYSRAIEVAGKTAGVYNLL
jgi:hypothetical protein